MSLGIFIAVIFIPVTRVLAYNNSGHTWRKTEWTPML